MIECKQRSDITYRCTKITKVSGKIVEIDHYETHPERRVVVRDRPIYKKVLGSRRYLATVFWSLSTATSDTQRERAFVKTAYPSQHIHSTKRFASNVTHPTKRFTSNVHNLRKSFTYNGTPTTIFQKGAHNHGKMAKITLSTQPPSRS